MIEKIIDYDRFIEEYKPVQQHDENAEYNGLMLDIHDDDDWQTILTCNPLRIWTILDNDSIVAGYKVVNRLGHIITKVWHNNERVTVELNEWCGNCNGDGKCPHCINDDDENHWLDCDHCQEHHAVCSTCKGKGMQANQSSPDDYPDCLACQDTGMVVDSIPRVTCVCEQ